MAYQGLFTQGITVDDLLKQRRVRSQANQQQMMDDAAQGARDPQRARMGSMFGSIIGKALGDNAGGADSEMEKLKAEQARLAADEQSYGTAALGTAAQMEAEIKRLQPTNPRAALALTQLFKKESDTEYNRSKTKEEASTKTQVSGAYLNAEQGTTNYDPTAMFSVDSVSNAITSIGRTGAAIAEDERTIKSREITEAYGHKAGTAEHKRLMQQSLNIGPSLSINDIKNVQTGWATTIEKERESIKTADEVSALVSLSSLSKDPEQIGVLADRLVSRLFGGSQSKAQAEMTAFRSSGSIGKRIKDSATMFLAGTYTKDTLEGFKKLAAFSKERNVNAYNKKLELASGQFSMADNLTTEQVGLLLGEPMELTVKPPKNTVDTGRTTVVGGITYRFMGGDQNDTNNWVEVE